MKDPYDDFDFKDSDAIHEYQQREYYYGVGGYGLYGRPPKECPQKRVRADHVVGANDLN